MGNNCTQMHAERMYLDLHKGFGIDPRTSGRSPHYVYIQVPTLVGMDVPSVAAQHGQIPSTIPVQFSPHQMEPKSVTVSIIICIKYCHMVM